MIRRDIINDKCGAFFEWHFLRHFETIFRWNCHKISPHALTSKSYDTIAHLKISDSWTNSFDHSRRFETWNVRIFGRRWIQTLSEENKNRKRIFVTTISKSTLTFASNQQSWDQQISLEEQRNSHRVQDKENVLSEVYRNHQHRSIQSQY